MFRVDTMVKGLFFKGIVLIAGLFFFFSSPCFNASASEAESLDVGFRHMYNLDFSGAHKTFEAWQHQHPEDPLGAAANACAYLFGELERLRILELDLFTDNHKFDEADKLSPDPKIKDAFEKELAKADELAAKILGQSANDRDALFAKTLTDGLRGNYAALIAKQNHAALDLLKSSRMTAEALLKIDPAYYDAYIAVGIENYLLGLRSAPTRWLLRMTGAQTDKEKGIANLKITAEKGHYLAPYARLLLVIACLRDKDRSTAKKILADLAREFPDNRLYQLELSRLRT